MPTLRAAMATAVVEPAPVQRPVSGTPEIIVERRLSDQPYGSVDRRSRPARNPGPVVLDYEQPRVPDRYVRLVDLALVIACLSIFLGVLAVGIFA